MTHFDPKKDITNLYTKHFENCRCNACWVQVTRNIRALVLSAYAFTGASSDQNAFEKNETLFADLLEFCSQFGDIPILLAGDFQNEPLQYPSLANAIRFGHWNDPLMHIDELGELRRPLTYSLDGSFSGAGDKNSSIDAILMNNTAMAALETIEVIDIDHCQHRPLRAVFNWHRVTQKGFVHVKPAPLMCEQVPTPGKTHATCDYSIRTESTWRQHFENGFDPNCSETAWQTINKFCLQTLLTEGATWGKGPKERGNLPTFVEKTACPGQLPDGMVKTKVLNLDFKLLNAMIELTHRLKRVHVKPADWHITRNLCKKTLKHVLADSQLQAWPKFEQPTLDILDANICRLKERITTSEETLKNQRIKNWRLKIRESAESTRSYIFHHLKNKVSGDPPNLITNKLGNIIYQPDRVISEINSQWDEIFAVNVLREDPINILRIIWPYIPHEHDAFEEPQLTAEALFATIQKRKAVAAPGLDGWRTSDLQKLPIAAFTPVAEYFHELERNSESLAQTLVCAKQIILNKNGLADPLQKRLITVLPAFILSYTGTRFRQLQEWQSKALPSSIFGAVSGRNMSTIANSIRLDIDHYSSNNDSIVGLKLDKSKCFDRINPDYAAALFVSFGLPKTIVAMFLKLYKGLKRHMFYRSWSTPNATTAANGVAQGCSFSLLAVNVYSKVWSCLLQRLPEISHAAFIDDSYIWCRLTNVAVLRQALQVTELWDVLAGQQFNHEKSKLFASLCAARKIAKETFPTIKICLEVDVLGTMLYTSERSAFQFPDEKVQKIVLDAKNIANLPLPVQTKASLAGTKILPQCSFASGISKIPKKDLNKIQAEITNILWHGKPKWRAKWLVLAMIGQPHRIEPNIARAYCTIIDFLHFYAKHSSIHEKLHAQIALQENGKHSLVQGVRDAFQVFDFTLDTSARLAYKNCPSLPLSEVDYKDLQKVLQYLARNICFQKANDLHRKDFKHPEAVFDYDLTFETVKKKSLPKNEGIPLESYLVNHMVGCSATRDRLAAAKFVDDPTCRFCHNAKESINHIMLECCAAKEIFGEEPLHELGANYCTLGLVEHPNMIAKHRLQINSELPALPSQLDLSCIQRIWTDGSVLWNANFWLQSGGYAVIGENEHVIAAGPLHHWVLDSYTTELWAVVIAISKATTRIAIFTDCKTIVDQFSWCRQHMKPPQDCQHPAWWRFICDALRKFSRNGEQAVELHWIPSHMFENVPISMITPEMAKFGKTEIDHVRGNRKADLIAKDNALLGAAIHPKDEKWLRKVISATHTRMAVIGKKLGQDVTMMKQSTQEAERVMQTPPDDPIALFSRRYPKWLWGLEPNRCQSCDIDLGEPCPSKWPFEASDWVSDFPCKLPMVYESWEKYCLCWTYISVLEERVRVWRGGHTDMLLSSDDRKTS